MLTRLWAGDGLRCIASWSKDRGMRHSWHETTDTALEAARRYDAAGLDVYFCPSLFAEKSRKQDTAVSTNTIPVDLDAGEGKPYASLKDALAGLLAWCKADAFPPPSIIVQSGGGLHCYWVLTESLTIARWEVLARRFKQVCLATGLKIDPSCTGDAARLLRVPGTRNHKGAEPRPVRVLQETDDRISPDEFSALMPAVGPRALPGPVHKVDAQWSVETDFPPADAEAIARKCRQMAHIREVRGKVEEPLWRAGLSVLHRCEGGEELIHEWSKGDERYDADETAAKAAGTAGPATCGYFASLDPSRCAGCPFAGKVVSPISLGTEPPAPRAHEEDDPAVERLNEVGPFKVTDKGIRLKVEDEDTGESKLELVSHCPIWVLEVRERAREDDEPDASSLMLQWHSLDGANKYAVIAQSEVIEPRSFGRWLGDHNLVSQVVSRPKLAAYVQEYTRELIRQKKTRRFYDRMGWYGGRFVVGTRSVGADGVREARALPGSVLARLTPRGSAEEWAAAMRVFDRPDRFAMQFAILCAFASPLLHFTEQQGVVVSLSGPSGTGKTSSMEAGISVYGDPRHISQPATTTLNAVGRQLAMLRDVPYGLDEVSRLSSNKVGDLLMMCANGEEKATLDQQRKARERGSWTNITILTTNRAITEFDEKDIDEALRRRLLELTVEKGTALTREDGARVHEAMLAHAGAPGLVYLQEVARRAGDLPRLLADAERALLKAGTLPDANRFASWTLAAALVGGAIARELGLIFFNPAQTVLQVAGVAAADAATIRTDEDRVVDAISEFLHERKEDLVYWSSSTETQSLAVNDARRPVARYDGGKDVLYVATGALRAWFQEQRISLKNLRLWMQRNDVENPVMRLAPGLSGIRCYAFPAKKVGLELG